MIADHFLQLRTDVEAALIGLLRLVAEIKQDATTADTLHGLLANIRQPLLFVVVGEVKSGKSSLLNALFGQEFAKADVLPTTDKICIFRYGKEEKTVDVSPQLIERYLPINFLQDFNIVDTPGTNTSRTVAKAGGGSPPAHRPARRLPISPVCAAVGLGWTGRRARQR